MSLLAAECPTIEPAAPEIASPGGPPSSLEVAARHLARQWAIARRDGRPDAGPLSDAASVALYRLYEAGGGPQSSRYTAAAHILARGGPDHF